MAARSVPPALERASPPEEQAGQNVREQSREMNAESLESAGSCISGSSLEGAASLGPVRRPSPPFLLDSVSCSAVISSSRASVSFWPELVSVRFLPSLANESVPTHTLSRRVPDEGPVLTAVPFSLVSHYV